MITGIFSRIWDIFHHASSSWKAILINTSITGMRTETTMAHWQESGSIDNLQDDNFICWYASGLGRLRDVWDIVLSVAYPAAFGSALNDRTALRPFRSRRDKHHLWTSNQEIHIPTITCILLLHIELSQSSQAKAGRKCITMTYFSPGARKIMKCN